MSVMPTKVQVNARNADVSATAMMAMAVMMRAISVSRTAAMRSRAPAIDRVPATAVPHDATLAIDRITAGTAAMRMTAARAMTVVTRLRSGRDEEDKTCGQQQEWDEFFHGLEDLAFDSLPAVSGVHV